jgi:hypothetical protein
MKRVYPFQVPGAEVTKASRGNAPRDHFRVVTAEEENEPRATNAGSSTVAGGSTAAQGKLDQAGIPASTMDQGEVRQTSSAASAAAFEYLSH